MVIFVFARKAYTFAQRITRVFEFHVVNIHNNPFDKITEGVNKTKWLYPLQVAAFFREI